ncbi:DUF1630-domain-containing protein [Gonapodya prolifera JEL478]|uniref:DUF1630-domain-containing protein n=1 Tax=Gonapodya prolifera (strain JEL478) TaxID=1344416 RepID=A0A139AYG7_GONPJ|nr:DUF1630-domain-containing protein [Gonapodya prolifera JEL478]|eukprot:KXS21776.1 DUF1630-domain-containing protein [Gonapodya prolifera JEL478]
MESTGAATAPDSVSPLTPAVRIARDSSPSTNRLLATAVKNISTPDLQTQAPRSRYRSRSAHPNGYRDNAHVEYDELEIQNDIETDAIQDNQFLYESPPNTADDGTANVTTSVQWAKQDLTLPEFDGSKGENQERLGNDDFVESSHSRSAGIPDHSALHRWILSFVVVTFDLERGQAIEMVYPGWAKDCLSESTWRDIAFSSFPDSNSKSHTGDAVFSFRVRCSTKDSTSSQGNPLSSGPQPPNPFLPSAIFPHSEIRVKPSPQLPTFLHCHASFRQLPSKSIRRGYLQKSIVIVSQHAWPGLWERIIGIVGNELFGDGKEIDWDRTANVLRNACADISDWPTPPAAPFSYHTQMLSTSPTSQPHGTSTITLTLSILERSLTTMFPPPSCSSLPLFYPLGGNPYPVTPCSLHSQFRLHIESLWPLYELVLLCRQILVRGDTPRACSRLVDTLVELVKPVAYGGEWRGFVTVGDSEVRSWRRLNTASGRAEAVVTRADLQSSSSPSRRPQTPISTQWRGGILGVTNPVFTKVLGPEWLENVVVVSKASGLRMGASGNGNVLQNGASGVHSVASSNQVSAGGFLAQLKSSWGLRKPNESEPPSTQQASSVQQPGETQNLEDEVQEVTLKWKGFFSCDKSVVKKVAEASLMGQPAYILDNILRRHFVDLTESIMMPLETYFSSLVVQGRISRTSFPGSGRLGSGVIVEATNVAAVAAGLLRNRPQINPFGMESFIKYVEGAGAPSLPIPPKRPFPEFYRLFLRTPTFATWLRERSETVFRLWRIRVLEALSAVGVDGKQVEVEHWAASKGEVEVVELLLRLRDEVASAEAAFGSEMNLDGAKSSAESEKPSNSPERQSLENCDKLGNEDQISAREGSSTNKDPEHVVEPIRSSFDGPTVGHQTNLTDSHLPQESLPPSRHRKVLETFDVHPTFEQLKNMRRAISFVVHALPEALRNSVAT